MLKLIPRYNWDYGLKDWIHATSANIFGNGFSREKLDDIFGVAPLWTSSGRASLFAILKAIGLKKGARVGVPLFCCPVVFHAITYAGYSPEFIDIDTDDFNVSPADFQKKRSALDAIVAVHMFGHPADLDSLSLASAGIPIVEDCAQSLFSQYKGHATGLSSIAAFFSFRSGKYISAGEGSAIVCSNSSLREEIRSRIDHFPKWRYLSALNHYLSTYLKACLYKRPCYGLVGYPIGRRLDTILNLSAKSGLKLKKIATGDRATISRKIRSFATKVLRQRENAIYLMSAVDSSSVILPWERGDCISNYYQFAVRFPNTIMRDRVAEYLLRHGIDTAKYLDGIADLARADYGYKGDCPNAELCSRTVLIIPHYYTLSRDCLDHIAQRLNEAAKLAR